MKILPTKSFKRPPIVDEEEEITEPRMMLSIADGDKILVDVEWPPGYDLSAFNQMVAWLNQGKLFELMLDEIRTFGEDSGELNQAIASQLAIANLIKNGKPKSGGVVVPPRKAIRHSFKMHQ